MNKIDLIAAVAEKTDLTRAKAGEAVDAVLAAIEGALKARAEVRLVGFGTFATAARARPARAATRAPARPSRLPRRPRCVSSPAKV